MISTKKVPHIGPLTSQVFILGEFPDKDADELSIPFSGRSGDFLNHCLSLSAFPSVDIRYGNVCNYRPYNNKFKTLEGSWQLTESLNELTSYIATSKPKLIIALGAEALKALTGSAMISKMRGSVLPYDNNAHIIATYHPAVALSSGKLAPQIIFDLTRAAKVLTHGYTLPKHEFIIDPSRAEFEILLQEVRDSEFITADIETWVGKNHILCFGVGLSRTKAFCLKNHYPVGGGMDGQFVSDIMAVLHAAKSITYHNGGFDTEYLHRNQIESRHNFTYDTMLAQRVLEPELPIGLDFCASIYTDERYYKDDRKAITNSKNQDKTWIYNCKDCIVTYATRVEQEKIFNSDKVLTDDRDFIFSRIPLMIDFQRNGMMVDLDRRRELLIATDARLTKAVAKVHMATGFELNFRSHTQVKKLLYDELKLPHRTDYDGKLTSDEDAIVSLIQNVQGEIDTKKTEKGKMGWKMKLVALKSLLDIRGLEKLKSSYLEYKLHDDNRVRTSWYPAGTDTGRWSAGNYIDDTGFNPQTMPRDKVELLPKVL